MTEGAVGQIALEFGEEAAQCRAVLPYGFAHMVQISGGFDGFEQGGRVDVFNQVAFRRHELQRADGGFVEIERSHITVTVCCWFINTNSHDISSLDYSASAANNSIAFESAVSVMIAFLVLLVKLV